MDNSFALKKKKVEKEKLLSSNAETMKLNEEQINITEEKIDSKN